MPIVFHLDMDAFFVACELLRKPELKGKAVVVGADPKGGKGRGVVSTCSYEARAFGIMSGMPISRAYRLCPDAVFLPVDFSLYVPMSQNVMEMLRGMTTALEQASIDEAFFTTAAQNYDEAMRHAQKIKQKIKHGLHLTCSIGIGPNKSIAKISSDYQKPDGLTVVRDDDVKSFLAPLPVRKLYGVGPKTERFLEIQNIHTIGDLARVPAARLANLGKWGVQLRELARGGGSAVIEDEQPAKSLSREHTFERDTNDANEIRTVIADMAAFLAAATAPENMAFRTVHLKIRFANFETCTRQMTITRPARDASTIEHAALCLLEPFLGSKKIRLIGVKVSHFVSGQASVDQFTAKTTRKK